MLHWTINDDYDRIKIANLFKFRIRMATNAATSDLDKFLPRDLSTIVIFYYADTPAFVDAIARDQEFTTIHDGVEINLATVSIDDNQFGRKLSPDCLWDYDLFHELLMLPELDDSGYEVFDSGGFHYECIPSMRKYIYETIRQ